MGNMDDYLDWRGDITFDRDPFNEVDNLILSELVYTDFGGILTESFKKSVPLSEVREKFFSMHTDEEIMNQVSSVKVAPYLMNRMTTSGRFSGMRLKGYVNRVSKSDQIQFSVVTYELPDDSIYVAFRGTDNSLIGWKEDFNMSFLHETPAQALSVKYLNRHFKDETRPIRVGGHSKGGNLAVYAASFCLPEIQEKIVEVFSNDGPGFLEEVTESEGYQRILPKVISTLPEQSIVGVLLESPKLAHRFVKSSNSGMMQHDAKSWQVMGNHFVYAEKQGNESEVMERSYRIWLAGLNEDERRRFTDLLFDSLMASGAKTTDDLKKKGMRVVRDGLKNISEASASDKKLLRDVFLRLAGSIGITRMDKVSDQIKDSAIFEKIGEMENKLTTKKEKAIREKMAIEKF